MIDWKPLEGLTEWPEAGEGQMIATVTFPVGDHPKYSPEECVKDLELTHYAIINKPPKPRNLHR